MEKAYAQAVQELLTREGADENAVIDGLIANLKARGRIKLLPKIKNELVKLRSHHQHALVEVAHKDEAHAALAAAAREGIHAEHAEVNASLIHGWRARQGSTLIDRSGKRTLVDLYRRITA